MERDHFKRLVIEAINALPQPFRDKLDNVEIVVEEWADADTIRLAKVRHPAELLGFYRGIPQTKRTHHYGMVLPDKISDTVLFASVDVGPSHACGMSTTGLAYCWGDNYDGAVGGPDVGLILSPTPVVGQQ